MPTVVAHVEDSIRHLLANGASFNQVLEAMENIARDKADAAELEGDNDNRRFWNRKVYHIHRAQQY